MEIENITKNLYFFSAVKCIRSIRRWSYETFLNERAIKFVVMVTPEDLKANADYIKIADFVCKVKGMKLFVLIRYVCIKEMQFYSFSKVNKLDNFCNVKVNKFDNFCIHLLVFFVTVDLYFSK